MRSHTLSGCPSETDSLVKRKFFRAIVIPCQIPREPPRKAGRLLAGLPDEVKPPGARSRPLVVSEQLHRVEDELALVGIGGLAEDSRDLHPVWRLQRARDCIGPLRFGEALWAVVALQFVIEILNRHAKHARDLE